MSEEKLYPIPAAIAAKAHIDADKYATLYRRSVEDPVGFWSEQAKQLVSWFKPWDSVLDWSFGVDDLHIAWYCSWLTWALAAMAAGMG